MYTCAPNIWLLSLRNEKGPNLNDCILKLHTFRSIDMHAVWLQSFKKKVNYAFSSYSSDIYGIFYVAAITKELTEMVYFLIPGITIAACPNHIWSKPIFAIKMHFDVGRVQLLQLKQRLNAWETDPLEFAYFSLTKSAKTSRNGSLNL